MLDVSWKLKKIVFQTRLPVYLAHTPAGTSVQNMIHFAQVGNIGYFCCEGNR